jgi:hypothetical protein
VTLQRASSSWGYEVLVINSTELVGCVKRPLIARLATLSASPKRFLLHVAQAHHTRQGALLSGFKIGLPQTTALIQTLDSHHTHCHGGGRLVRWQR